MTWGEIKRVWLPGVLVAGGFFWFFFRGPGPDDAFRWIGFGLAIFGFAGIFLARYSLGRSFSVVPKATELVTTGIYSKVRNPIYISSVLYVTGVVMILRMPVLYLFPIILIPVQWVRARAEARVLEAKFGDEYRRYRDSTWF